MDQVQQGPSFIDLSRYVLGEFLEFALKILAFQRPPRYVCSSECEIHLRYHRPQEVRCGFREIEDLYYRIVAVAQRQIAMPTQKGWASLGRTRRPSLSARR